MAATAPARALMARDSAETGAVVGTAASTCITSTEAEAGAARRGNGQRRRRRVWRTRRQGRPRAGLKGGRRRAYLNSTGGFGGGGGGGGGNGKPAIRTRAGAAATAEAVAVRAYFTETR